MLFTNLTADCNVEIFEKCKGEPFLKCSFCSDTLLSLLKSKPFVKHLKTALRIDKSQISCDIISISTNRGILVNKLDRINPRENARILLLEQIDQTIIPETTPDYITIFDTNTVFENEIQEFFQHQPYKAYVDEVSEEFVYSCPRCTFSKKIKWKVFNAWKCVYEKNCMCRTYPFANFT